MKYVLMCGGDYEFKKPLCEVRGEKLVERTIRLLKENNADDIVISTNHKDYDYLGLPIIKQKKKRFVVMCLCTNGRTLLLYSYRCIL